MYDFFKVYIYYVKIPFWKNTFQHKQANKHQEKMSSLRLSYLSLSNFYNEIVNSPIHYN